MRSRSKRGESVVERREWVVLEVLEREKSEGGKLDNPRPCEVGEGWAEEVGGKSVVRGVVEVAVLSREGSVKRRFFHP